MSVIDPIEYNRDRPPDVTSISSFHRPCPFCGGRNLEVHYKVEIACMDCGLRARRILHNSIADMGELWDMRGGTQ